MFFFDSNLPQTRKVVLRMAIVLGKDGGVITPLTNLVRFGLGGKQGTGKQMFSWIHLEDLFQIILFLQKNEQLKGVLNCSSPNPVDNSTLMKTLRGTLGIKFGLDSPSWLLKIGAFFIRTEVELILKSRWVIPEKLLEAGYHFVHPTLKGTLANILKADN